MKPAPPHVIRRILLLCIAPALVLTACPIPTDSEPVDSVAVTSPSPTVVVGQTVQLSASARSSGGQSLNRPITWSSSNNAVAMVDGNGLVSGVAIGPVTITASSDGKSGTVNLDVLTTPTVATQTASDITATSGRMNGTINPNNGSTNWGFEYGTSSSLGSACTGNSPITGSQPVTVSCNLTEIPSNVPTVFYRVFAQNSAGRSEGQILSFNITGGGGGADVTLTGISPNTLVQGQSATLTGTGFSATPGNNQVTIGGAAATVTAATATSLQIAVPNACLPAGSAEVRVAVGNQQSNVLQHPFQPSQFLNVQVGQQVVLRDPAQFCLQFQPSSASEAYLIGVQAVSEVVSSLTPVTVQALAAPAPAGSPASFAMRLPAETPLQVGARPSTPRVTRAQAVRPAGHAEVEQRIRRFEQQLINPRIRELQARSGRRELQLQSVTPQNLQVGQTIEIRVPNIHPGKDACSEFIPIQATVRVVGQRGIWLEDQSNPAGGFTAADFQSLSNFFDTQVYGTITGFFGEPTDVDNNQKILIVATKEVNRAGTGLAGFVIGTDFFPRTQEGCLSSNQGEIYYSAVPDPTGIHGSERARDDVLAYQNVVIPHEFTHIIQVGRRIFLPGAQALMSIWEAEGGATLAEEIMGHAQTNRQPGQNYGASVILNNPQTSPISWYLKAFTGLVEYYGWRGQEPKAQNAPEQCSWLDRPENQTGSPCTGGELPYGTAWSFLRWLSDHHGSRFPGGERGLHQAMILHQHSGFRTIEEVIGRPMHELLAQWAAMLYVDDRVGGAQASLTLPSWNLFDFEQNVVETGRLVPRQRSFSSFTDAVSVRAASAAYFRVSGAGRPGTAIRVRDGAGNPLPAHVQVWIVRLQ